MAKEGKEQPLPEYLATDVDPSEGFGLSGIRQVSLAEIPFEPGTLPAKKSKVDQRQTLLVTWEQNPVRNVTLINTTPSSTPHTTKPLTLASLQEITGPLNGERSPMQLASRDSV